MRHFAVLIEELESRPDDVDRVGTLARYLRAVGPRAGALAGAWLVPAARGTPAGRPPRVTQAALFEAAAALAEQGGMARWLFDAGAAASPETAEAIAQLLPWPPDDEAPGAARPTLADWTRAWAHAAATTPAATRAGAVAATIAALDDPLARRWAVRAACGLARPFVDAWQWQRAWGCAFDEDPYVLAWRWHRQGGADADADADAPNGARPPHDAVPRPRDFAPLPEAPVQAHAALLAAAQLEEFWVEPRWRGLRVQVVRRGADVAVWQRPGRLLNGLLPADLLDAAWPDPCVIEGVLVGWQDGRSVGIDAALMAASAPAPRRRKAAATDPAGAPSPSGPTLHLVLTDWHHWAGDEAAAVPAAQRRARLQDRWPPPDVDGGEVSLALKSASAAPAGAAIGSSAGSSLPAVFTTPTLRTPGPARDAGALGALADAGRAAGWGGVVLRLRGEPAPGDPHGRPGTAADVADAVDAVGAAIEAVRPEVAAWTVRASAYRVRAVLQYVASEALAAGAAGAAALAFVPCGFAVWNRAPQSEGEQRAAMTAAMAGEFIAPPADAPALPGLRLLPLVRSPLALPADELERLHAWLRANVGLRFGGVHAVAPAQVFEIAFTQLRASRRHRLGAVMTGASVLAWLADAPPGSAHLAGDLLARMGE